MLQMLQMLQRIICIYPVLSILLGIPHFCALPLNGDWPEMHVNKIAVMLKDWITA